MGDKKLTVLHFNDVYNIEPQKMEPAGGAARMSHYVKSLKEEKPMVLFSGDALNPSLMSIFLKGDQMIPVLNDIGVHCAVYGNHDFDFGVDHLEDFAEQTTFPWLLSNITDKINNMPLANGEVKKLIDWHGVKVGLMGLVEEEWIDTLSTIDPADIIFEDFVEVGNKLAKELREEGADFVIALTHMRWPNDRKVAREVDVDIVLGGHDHDYIIEEVNGKHIIKSGTDFRNMSKVMIEKKKADSAVKVTVERVDFDSTFPEDIDLKKEVIRLSADIDDKMDEHLGNMGVTMDGRFSSIRTMETNLGNFVTDIILEAVPADICMMNSGTFRSDRIHSKGEFKLRDLLTILPLVDPLIVIQITGADIIQALENGVSQYPKLEGRFPQVAGVKFVFDPSKPSGSRVNASLVKVQDAYVHPEKKYRLCTKEYIASGKDGYDMLKDCEVVVTSEQCPTISTAVRNHFESVQILKDEKPCRSGHRQSLCSIVRRTILIQDTVEKFMSLSKTRKASTSSSSSVQATTDESVQQTVDETDSSSKVTLTDSANGSTKDTMTNSAKQEHKQNKAKVNDRDAGGDKDRSEVEGSPRKRAKKDVTETKEEAIQEEVIQEVKAESCCLVTNSGTTTTTLEYTNLSFRRDSMIADPAHLAHLARITQMFVKPVKTAPKAVSKANSHAFMRQMSIEDVENEQTHLCPKVEGRIVKGDEKMIQSMLASRSKEDVQNVQGDLINEDLQAQREPSVESSASN